MQFFHQQTRRIRCAVSALAILFLLSGCAELEQMAIADETLKFLGEIREQKSEAMEAHFLKLHLNAADVSEDSTMLRFFNDLLNSESRLLMGSPIQGAIDKHFVFQYGEFYDLLFVDSTGYIFYSIRQESDYHTTIFQDAQASGLARHLASDTGISFVDFEYYDPSQEPAAFHVVPVRVGEVRFGWFVFQQSLNKVNAILTERQELGQTGEVYLVNSNGIMLTESRFIKEPTVLKKKINTKAVEISLAEGKYERIVKDYRGVSVFSSSRKLDILGTSWVIIAEIDESEVITDYYRRSSGVLTNRLIDYLASVTHEAKGKIPTVEYSVKVDMNEFGLVKPGEKIRTWGVNTCTAVAISFPGKFSYLAHLVPIDDSYVSNIPKLFLSDDNADLLGSLMRRIKRFDIYPYELSDLKFTIISTHDNSFPKIIHKLTECGVAVSQIKVMYNPDVGSANVTVEPNEPLVTVEWVDRNGKVLIVETDALVPGVDFIIKEIAGLHSEVS